MFITDATHLPRLMQCFASDTMPASVQSESDQTTRNEGNAAHWLAQQVFAGKSMDDMAGKRAYNGVVIDADMVRHVSEYLSALDRGVMECATSFASERWMINARADHISVRGWVEADPHATGPIVLTVDDFKYGHRLVSPVMNWTLIAHAVGHCINAQITPDEIVLRIHQPRRYHPEGHLREWRISYAELMALYQQIDTVLSGADTMLRTGPQCVNCHAIYTCPAYREASMNAIDVASASFNDDLSPEILSAELDLLGQASDVINARLKALQELAMHRIVSGAVIPEYSIDTPLGQRRFLPTFDAKAIRVLFGLPCTEEKLVTVAELERRGASPEFLKMITERPVTSKKLVRMSADARAKKLLRKGK